MKKILDTLLTIMWKNFKLIFRSKTSALIILIGPVLIIAIVGSAFNTSGLNNIRIGVYIPAPTDDTEMLINSVSSKNIILDEFDEKEKCIEEVKDATIHMCMAFPPDFSLENLQSGNKIEFYVDYSRMNLVWMIWDIIKARIRHVSSEISLAFTETMIDKINETTSELVKNRDSIIQVSTDGKEMAVKLQSIKGNFTSFDLEIPFSDAEIESIKEKTETSEDDIEDFKSKLGDIDTEIEAAREQVIAQNEQSIAALTEFEIELQESKNGTIEHRQATQEAFDDYCVDTALTDHEACTVVLQGHLDFLDAQLDIIDGFIADVQANKADLESQEIPEPDTGLDEIEDDLDSYADQIAEMRSSVDKFTQSIDSAKSKVNEFSTLQNSTASEFDEITTILDDNLHYLNKVTQGIDELTAKLSDLSFVNADNIIKPIGTQMKSITHQKKFINYMLPSLLILVVMFISILLSSTTVLTERESRAFFRNFLAPVNDLVFIAANYLSNAIIIMGQSIVLLLVSYFYFGVSIAHFGSLLLIFLLVTTTFILIGMFIGYFFKSEETSTIASISFSCLFLLFSSLAVPVETMSKNIAMLANLNPFVLGESMLKKVLLFNKTIFDSNTQLLVLCIYIAVLFAAVIFLHHVSKNME